MTKDLKQKAGLNVECVPVQEFDRVAFPKGFLEGRLNKIFGGRR